MKTISKFDEIKHINILSLPKGWHYGKYLGGGDKNSYYSILLINNKKNLNLSLSTNYVTHYYNVILDKNMPTEYHRVSFKTKNRDEAIEQIESLMRILK